MDSFDKIEEGGSASQIEVSQSSIKKMVKSRDEESRSAQKQIENGHQNESNPVLDQDNSDNSAQISESQNFDSSAVEESPALEVSEIKHILTNSEMRDDEAGADPDNPSVLISSLD